MFNHVRKILHIDDDEDDFIILKELVSSIKNASFELNWASNDRDALNMLQKNNYDLCLLDYQLGAVNGLDFIKTLQENNIDVPVIFLTGQGDRDVDEEARAAGAVDYILKGTITSAAFERLTRYVISNHQTEKVRREAESLQKTKELAGAVAHEFSQPLQVLSNYYALIKHGGMKDSYIEKIGKQITRIKELTDRLRNITGLQQKKYLDTQILDLYANQAEVLIPSVPDRILIVDDEKDVLESLLEIFELSGYVCDGAINGIEALELFQKNKYKFIISDVMMPEMSGPEFFLKIREKGFNGIFVFITGYELSKDFEAIIHQADAVFNKPVSYNHFIKQVETIMTKKLVQV